MPRLARTVVPEYPHHVTQRGNRRQSRRVHQGGPYELILSLAFAATVGMVAGCRRAASESETRQSPDGGGHIETGVYHFWATVGSIESWHSFSGRVIPVDAFPSFVVSLELSGDSLPARYRRGETIHFAVHSVVETFGAPAEEVIGKSLRFKFILVEPVASRELEVYPDEPVFEIGASRPAEIMPE